MKVVLDTNLLVSGLINAEGLPAQGVNLLTHGRLTPLYDSRILKEYEEVLCRESFGFTKSTIAPLLDHIRKEGEYVAAEPAHWALPDHDDKMFCEVAKTAHARYLVTENKDHFPKDAIVRSPKEFIQLFFAESAERGTKAYGAMSLRWSRLPARLHGSSLGLSVGFSSR
jgi:uncharacterized protein